MFSPSMERHGQARLQKSAILIMRADGGNASLRELNFSGECE